MKTLEYLLHQSLQQKKPLFAMLVDPDQPISEVLLHRLKEAEKAGVDLFFVGGSLLSKDHLSDTIQAIRACSKSPVVLFPGSSLQLSDKADAILFLSLVSGRNPDLLIGQHVVAAPYIKKSRLEVLPTAYILVDGGRSTTAHYVSQTQPIPHDKPAIAANTALAAEFLGMRLTYLDAGSGADNPVSPEMIAAVRRETISPIVVGGGIKSAEQARKAVEAGANVVVVGNGIEKSVGLIHEIAFALKTTNKTII